jgi:hypothetical protein
MTQAYLSPILQNAQFSDDGTFLNGGLIWFYAAGTSTPLTAYQDGAATTPWPNPIVLNARGETGGELWLEMKINWSEASTKRGIIWAATAVVGSVFVFMGKPVDQLFLLSWRCCWWTWRGTKRLMPYLFVGIIIASFASGYGFAYKSQAEIRKMSH